MILLINKDYLVLKEKIIKGLELTYERLIKDKIAKNLKIAVSENGKVIIDDPKKFQK